MNETMIRKDAGVTVVMSESGQPQVNVVFSGIPLKLWEQWNKVCEENYHEIRWLKLWSDHLVTENKIRDRDEIVSEVLDHVNFQLEQAQQKASEEDSDDEIRTFR